MIYKIDVFSLLSKNIIRVMYFERSHMNMILMGQNYVEINHVF